MKKKLVLTALVLTLIANIQTAQARDLVRVAQDTIYKVTVLSQDFAATMQAKADTAADKITNLLADGNVTSAKRLAKRTIEKTIRGIRNRGLNRVNNICNSIYLDLREAGLFDLAAQVLAACTQANNLLWASSDQAVATVNAALAAT